MGLRQKQKQDRRGRILNAAAKLFVRKGYGRAKAEDIAEAAEVSIGTLYNYFNGKGDILLALAAMESEGVFEHNIPFLAAPEGTAVEALDTLFASYFDPDLIFLNADVWQQSIAISYASPDTENARRLRNSDRMLCGQVVELLATLKADGRINAGTDCRIMGEVLFNNMNMLFFELIRSNRKDMDEVRQKIATMTRAVVALISPPDPGKRAAR